jgi:uncharacterized RDD family membrane protein YckC
MSINNPYAAPQADMSHDNDIEENELASRWQRVGAAIIDGLIAMCWAVPLSFALGTISYQKRGIQPPYSLTLLSIVLGFIIFVIVHGYFLKTNGQTIGKKLVGIRIVALDGNLATLGKLLGLRYLLIQLIFLIPGAGAMLGGLLSVVDCLFVFRSDRRCVHDLIAGTRVVKM